MFNLLTRNYNIIPTYSYQTKEQNMMLNVTLILFLIMLILIIVYIIYYSETYKIRINAV